MNAAADASTATLEDLVRALYETISYPRGGHPDWERERRLFGPQARLARLSEERMETFTVEEYRANFEAMLAAGTIPELYERQIAARTVHYADIAHCFSTFEVRRSPADPEVLWRGVNSIQAYRREGRWWIASIVWFREGSSTPLPQELLP